MAGINMADSWSADLPACAIDIAQALRAGWLELWYQPKLGSQALDLRGAEALIRMRHPQLGLVQPANFMPATRDPHFRALSAIRHRSGTRRLALLPGRAAAA
jgi:EAL domain-containing protein (putative c-di-GMP-specific phosphodiesterase class I)